MQGIRFWVVDYDIPVKPHAKRRAFYRALHKVLTSHEIEADRSTQSVWIIDSQEIAEEIHGIADRYGRSNLYSASRIS